MTAQRLITHKTADNQYSAVREAMRLLSTKPAIQRTTWVCETCGMVHLGETPTACDGCGSAHSLVTLQDTRQEIGSRW